MKDVTTAMVVACVVLAGIAADAKAEGAGSGEFTAKVPTGEVTSSAEPIGRGITFEANVGVALLRFSPNHRMSADEPALMLNLGFGRWISSHAALTMRFAGSTYVGDGVEVPSAFAGGVIQLWTCKRFWFGGGLGMGVATTDFAESGEEETKAGLAVDGRLGITPYVRGNHSINLSFEVTSVFLERGSVTSLGLSLGYQAL